MKAAQSDKSITTSRKRGQYNTACSLCHKRKTKCDGIKPTCQRCRESGRESECKWVRPNAKVVVNRPEGNNHHEEKKVPEVHSEKYIGIHHNNVHVSQ